MKQTLFSVCIASFFCQPLHTGKPDQSYEKIIWHMLGNSSIAYFV